ncbi:MAG: sigma-70 family RNA polymerase sigma factor [Clostridia bacterium]|nr:sigma-70 family RNA polymerase sigma factor [Clostridia bacterium]
MLSLYLSMVNNPDSVDKIRYIYERYYAYMYYCAEQVLGHRDEDIKDATHNAMIKIIEHIDSVDLSDERRAKSYFGTIAKNKAKDILKSKYNKILPIDDVVDYKESGNDVETVRFEYEMLINSIFKLDEKYRDVLILKYVNELGEKEISRLLDIPQKTVSTRILRGKKRLLAILKEDSDVN